jgi:hypothetical protein
MKPEQLQDILKKHAAWLRREVDGERADLQGADLRGADLRGANLQGANLRGADLWSADLWSADLQGADLRGADLWSADLQGADLRGANLQGANLQGADLRGADLWSANLTDTKLPVTSIVPESGPFEAYKKIKSESGADLIVTLYVPRSAQRAGGLTERKCRVSKVKVKRIQTMDGADVTEGFAKHDNTKYTVGAWVRPDSFNPDVREVCTNGIHCFITRREAEEY